MQGKHAKRLLLDSRAVDGHEVVQPHACHPFLLAALLFNGLQQAWHVSDNVGA
jgi:hypothetical protein